MWTAAHQRVFSGMGSCRPTTLLASKYHNTFALPKRRQLSSLSTTSSSSLSLSSSRRGSFSDANTFLCSAKNGCSCHKHHRHHRCYHHHHHQSMAIHNGTMRIDGGVLQPKQQQQQQILLRSFSSSGKGTGGDEAVDADSFKTTNNNNAADNGATDLGIPGAQKGGKKLAIVFTCTVCDTRSAKQFTEHAYQNGVVIVQCPGCKNRHLIADNLGFFDDADGGWNIEKGMEKLGEDVKVVTNKDVLELSVEDIWGTAATMAAAATNTTDDNTTTTTTTTKSEGDGDNGNTKH